MYLNLRKEKKYLPMPWLAMITDSNDCYRVVQIKSCVPKYLKNLGKPIFPIYLPSNSSLSEKISKKFDKLNSPKPLEVL